MNRIGPYWKAVVGFVTPGVTALLVAVADMSPGGTTVTGPEWVGIGAACILTGGAVFTAGNVARDAQPAVDPAQRGALENAGDVVDDEVDA